MSATPEMKPLPPPRKAPPLQAAPAPAQLPAADRFVITSGKVRGAQRVMLYGPGGIGKSSLASLAPNPIVLDLEEGTRGIDVQRINGGSLHTWADLRACLQAPILDSFDSIVIDSVTRAEEWAIAHTLATVPHEKGHKVTSLEGYGFGKGYQMVFEVFGLILPDLDRHVRAGRNVILIAHDCTADVPNPTGDDFIRYEPHLQQPKSGRASIRERVFQWADHVLFLGYDVVTEDGKGRGEGTRTIWPVERPDHRAKSRSIAEPIPFEGPTDGAIWSLVFGGAQ